MIYIKKYIFKAIIIVLSIIMFTNYTHAFATGSTLIPSVYSNTDYVLDITIRNFKYEKYDIAYVGQLLSDLYPTGKVTTTNNEIIQGHCEWEDKKYILTKGAQEVVLIFNSYSGEKIEFLITIKPSVLEIKPEVKHVYEINYNDYVFERYVNTPLEKIVPTYKFWSIDEKNIEGIMEYSNYDDLSIGYHEIGWKFTPSNNIYESKEGIYRVQIIPKPTEKTQARTEQEEEIDELTTPSLTATSILLDSKLSYDINLNNKISGSSYKWISGNPKVAKVNAKNGLVTAVSECETIVTCEITLPDGSKNILESLITVGYDENAPLLTETILDLEVGDKFDINLENKVAKSKYRWVSSNRDIIKVNSSNGKVTAIGIGEAYVTCTITTPENQVIVLKCDIIVTE